jgi:hypothetical protein
MPGANPVFASWDALDAECAAGWGLCEVRMIEHRDPRVSPRMLLGHHFDFGRDIESVDGHYLAVIVERRHSNDLSGPDVDEAVRLQRPVVVSDVERAVRGDHLHVRVENAFVVREIEAAAEWKCFPASDVGQPDNGAANASPAQAVGLLHDGRPAHLLIYRGSDNLFYGHTSLELDYAGNSAPIRNRCDFVRLRGWRDD